MKNSSFFGIVLLFSLSLAGCLDYEEEMWLNADLSGHVTVTVSLPEEMVKGGTGLERDLSEQGFREDVERIPGVTLEKFESFRDAGNVVAKASIKFEDVEQLTRYEQGVAQMSAASMLGSIKVTEEGRKVTLERVLNTIPEVKSEGGAAKDFFAKGLSSLLFSKHYLTYKIHMPAEVITANSRRIEGRQQTVEWSYSLSQAMREPPVMVVAWKKPFPFFSLIGGAVALGAAVLVFKWWRDRTRHTLH